MIIIIAILAWIFCIGINLAGLFIWANENKMDISDYEGAFVSGIILGPIYTFCVAVILIICRLYDWTANKDKRESTEEKYKELVKEHDELKRKYSELERFVEELK